MCDVDTKDKQLLPFPITGAIGKPSVACYVHVLTIEGYGVGIL